MNKLIIRNTKKLLHSNPVTIKYTGHLHENPMPNLNPWYEPEDRHDTSINTVDVWYKLNGGPFYQANP